MDPATQALARVIEHSQHFAWLEPPVPNGTLTVADVMQARDAAEHWRLVDAWARDVWQAWKAHHATVRGLAARYLK